MCYILGPLQENMANPKEKTPMCLVNELARFNRLQPQYKLLSERGPAHAKVSVFFFAPAAMLSTELFLKMYPCLLTCLPPVVSHLQIFTVQLTLGEQVWEAEGTSIKKAQHSTAAKALDESMLPRPAPRSPKVDINSNPGSSASSYTNRNLQDLSGFFQFYISALCCSFYFSHNVCS